jgi:hypothetical protein
MPALDRSRSFQRSALAVYFAFFAFSVPLIAQQVAESPDQASTQIPSENGKESENGDGDKSDNPSEASTESNGDAMPKVGDGQSDLEEAIVKRIDAEISNRKGTRQRKRVIRQKDARLRFVTASTSDCLENLVRSWSSKTVCS